MAAAIEQAHLADLHDLAAELGIERYRMLSREELSEAIRERDPDARSKLPERGRDESQPSTSEPSGGGRTSDRDAQSSGERPRRNRGGRGRGRGRSDDSGRSGGESDEQDDEEPETGEPVAGVLDITPRGHGFIRVGGLESDDDDVYVSPSQIRRCEMRRGDEVAGPARKPRRGERYPALIHVDKINGVEPGSERLRLADATPAHPSRRINPLAPDGASPEDAVLVRSVDLLNPLAFGQRVLVQAASGSGRTTLLRALAAALAPRDDLELVVLLIDERPEEVSAWRDAAPGADLAIATADMRSGEQLRLVELALGRASRRAEAGADVVLLVDSLSRIAVAADDPDRVKPIFGAGRETEEEGTGSLTVIATTLDGDGGIDVADDDGGVARVLKSTETSLLVLDPGLAAARTFPAIDFAAGRLTGEEHLREGAELDAARALRAELGAMAAADASRTVRERIDGSPDNAALLSSSG